MAVPAAPVWSSIAASTTNIFQHTLTWGAVSASPAVTFYQIERCLGTGCTTFSVYATVSAPSVTRIVGAGTDTPDGVVRYRMRAINADGPGPYSSVLITKTGNSKIIRLSNGTTFGNETLAPLGDHATMIVFPISPTEIPDGVQVIVSAEPGYCASAELGSGTVAIFSWQAGVVRAGLTHNNITGGQYRSQIEFTGEFGVIGNPGTHTCSSYSTTLKKSYNETDYPGSAFPRSWFTLSEFFAHHFGILFIRHNSNAANPYTFSIAHITEITLRVSYGYGGLTALQESPLSNAGADYSDPCCDTPAGVGGTPTGVSEIPQDQVIIPVYNPDTCDPGGTIFGAPTPTGGEIWTSP